MPAIPVPAGPRRTALRLALAMLAILLAGVAAPAQGDVTRTCRAAYMINETGVHGNWIRRDFAARGTSSLPNWARSAARIAIEACVREHWANRNRDHPPPECGQDASWGEVVNYPFESLEAELTRLVCSHFGSREQVTVDIAIHLDGDRGCIGPSNQWSIPVANGYTFDCTITPQGTIRPGFEDLPRFDRP